MKQWSICGYVINYVGYNRNPIDYYEVDVMALELKYLMRMYDKIEEDNRQVVYLTLSDTPEKFKEYIDVYEGVRPEILYTNKFVKIQI